MHFENNKNSLTQGKKAPDSIIDSNLININETTDNLKTHLSKNKESIKEYSKNNIPVNQKNNDQKERQEKEKIEKVNRVETNIYRELDPNKQNHPADVAAHISDLSLEEQVSLLRSINIEDAAEVLAEMDEEDRVNILENLESTIAAKMVSEMSPDDAADMLDELEEDYRDELLNNLETKEAEEIRSLMSFDPDTAGGIMNTEIVIVPCSFTADEAIHLIRSEIEDKEVPYYVYMVDEKECLKGVISLKALILCPPTTPLNELIKDQHLVTVRFDESKEIVAAVLSHYNYMAIPVIDYEWHLLGIITYDDVFDIMDDVARKDLLGMVGAGEDETIHTKWTTSVTKRLPWLIINLINSALSASVVYCFEGTISQMAILAVLMPMVANQAGNTGQQALAVMIRQLATDRFEPKKFWRAVLREGHVGLINGILLSILAFFGVFFMSGNLSLALVMSFAMVSDMIIGAMAGASIPLILKSLGRDPAQASSIFLTTLTDGGGFFIFLGLATLFLL